MADYSSLRRGLQHYWSMDNGSSPYTQWDRMRTANLGMGLYPGTLVPRAEGKIGYATRFSSVSVGANKDASIVFATSPNQMTLSIWFRMDDPTANPVPISSIFGSPPTGAFLLQYINASAMFRFQYVCVAPMPLPGPSVYADVQYTASSLEWIHAFLFIDVSGQKIGLKINALPTVWTYDPQITVFAKGYSFRLGPQFSGLIDDTAIWYKLLDSNEQSWVWNDGSGLGYDSFAVVADTTTCQEIPCCEDDPYTYEATSATPSGSSTGSDCAEVPMVTIEPPESSAISFPTFIILTSSLTGSVIRYTTDGTEPDEDSTVYSIPFQIFGPSETVKAKAWLGDCVGPTVAAAYHRLDAFDVDFYNICTPPPILPLRAGIWGEFVAPFTSTVNYGWMLEFTNTALLHVTSFEIYETNSSGFWNTGQAWGTQEYIDPPNGTTDFHVYPLVLREGGALNTAYSDDFSTDFGHFAIGAHAVAMYGGLQFDVPGVTYFRLRMFLEGGTVVERIIASNTCDPPPCTERPPDPTVTAQCGTLTVEFTTTAGLPYYITRWDSATYERITVKSGNTTAGPDTFIDGGLMPNVMYCYALWVQYAGCPDYVSSNDSCGQILLAPTLDITQDITHIYGDSGTVTFTIISSGVDPLGICGSNEVEYAYTDGGGAFVGSVLANQTVLKAFAITRPAIPGPYVASFDFSACNDCATVTVHKDVTFEPPPCCGNDLVPPVPDSFMRYVLKDYLITALQNTPQVAGCMFCNYILRTTQMPAQWDGTIRNTSICTYIKRATDYESFCNYRCNLGGVDTEVTLGYLYAAIDFHGVCNAPTSYWHLAIMLNNAQSGDLVLWDGKKAYGNDPIGTYTQIGGCVTLATIIVS